MSDTTALLKQLGYSDKAIDYILNRTNVGPLDKPNIQMKHQGDCGDMMELFLKIENNTITDASFLVVGCAGLQASGSTVTEMLKGASLDEASKIEVDHIRTYSEGIPDSKLDCMETARDTVKMAVKQYLEQN